MISKKAPPKLDSYFFYKLHRHQQPKDTTILIYQEVSLCDAETRTLSLQMWQEQLDQPQDAAASALTSRYQHRQQHFNTFQSHVCTYFQNQAQVKDCQLLLSVMSSSV